MKKYSNQRNMVTSSGGQSGFSDLAARIMFTIVVLIVYRFGTYIPLPGVDSEVLYDFASTQSTGILGILNVFTGGALERLSIFMLNIVPYITASIVIQMMTVIFESLAALKKEGSYGRQKLSQYTKYLTIILALFQGYGIAVGAEHITSSLGSAVITPGIWFRFTSMFSLMGGTIFVMWLGEQITSRGVGNGSSIIIFSGIVSGLPRAISVFFDLGKTGAIATAVMLMIGLVVAAMVVLIVFVEKAQRKILVQYTKRQVGNKIYGAESTHMPIKINTSGVIPPIFANAVLSFPVTMLAFSSDKTGWFGRFISQHLSHGKLLYMTSYVVLIAFFSFFYSSVVFNTEETADNLRKNGGVVLGRRPGPHTAEYFDHVISRLTVIGIIYTATVCVMPEILISKYGIPFYLGGTSMMIVVNVVIDLFTQVQTHLLSVQYATLIKRTGRG